MYKGKHHVEKREGINKVMINGESLNQVSKNSERERNLSELESRDQQRVQAPSDTLIQRNSTPISRPLKLPSSSLKHIVNVAP